MGSSRRSPITISISTIPATWRAGSHGAGLPHIDAELLSHLYFTPIGDGTGVAANGATLWYWNVTAGAPPTATAQQVVTLIPPDLPKLKAQLDLRRQLRRSARGPRLGDPVSARPSVRVLEFDRPPSSDPDKVDARTAGHSPAPGELRRDAIQARARVSAAGTPFAADTADHSDAGTRFASQRALDRGAHGGFRAVEALPDRNQRRRHRDQRECLVLSTDAPGSPDCGQPDHCGSSLSDRQRGRPVARTHAGRFLHRACDWAASTTHGRSTG